MNVEDVEKLILLMQRYELNELALKEEKDAEAEFGDEWRRYAAVTPRFIPKLTSSNPQQQRS